MLGCSSDGGVSCGFVGKAETLVTTALASSSSSTPMSGEKLWGGVLGGLDECIRGELGRLSPDADNSQYILTTLLICFSAHTLSMLYHWKVLPNRLHRVSCAQSMVKILPLCQQLHNSTDYLSVCTQAAAYNRVQVLERNQA